MSIAGFSLLLALILVGLTYGMLEVLIKLSDRECGCDDFE